MNEFLHFCVANFVPLLMLFGALFVFGLLMRFVGKHIERKYTKQMRQHEWDMTGDEWESWSREQGYRRTQR